MTLCARCGKTHPAPQFAPGRIVFDLKDGVAFTVEDAVYDHMSGQVLYWRTIASKHPRHSRGRPAEHLIPWGPAR